MLLASSNIYERVVKIETREGLGTGTTLDRGTEVFAVTAAHVLPIDPAEPVAISNRFRSFHGVVDRLSGIDPGLDLAVVHMPDEFAHPDLPLPATADGSFYSQEVLFLGFPYGLSLADERVGFLPFVKRATLSASEQVQGGKLWYLDGLNNPGFSGGPVVFAPPEQHDVRLLAVISGYRRDWQNLHVAGAATAELVVSTNSGIIIAYDVAPAVAAIDAAMA